MPSLNDDFKELMERVRYGRDFAQASFEPIYYLVFPPKYIIDVKRQMPAWKSKLKSDGWDVFEFSIANELLDIVKSAPLRKIWLDADSKNPLEWDKANKSIANLLSQGELQNRLEKTIQKCEGKKNSIVLVTDLEALHPYMRIGAIESQLQGKFSVVTVFFYPGERAGKTSLKFLGFYPEDGNYRSVHVGGY